MPTYQAIPWANSSSAQISLWAWKTPHFVAKISSSHGTYMWEVVHVADGFEKTLYDGLANSFKEAEDNVREIVGKSYPRALGYIKYAGNLANTFLVNNGEMFDFTPLIGKYVTVYYITKNSTLGVNEIHHIKGSLSVVHYKIVVQSRDGDGLEIPPASVTKILDEDSKDVPLVERSNEVKLRIYRGGWSRYCTGKPGVLPGTVEHPQSAPQCPVHE